MAKHPETMRPSDERPAGCKESAPTLTDQTLRMAPAACYWAVIEDLPRGLNDEALRYAMETWLPAPLEEVEARFVRRRSITIGCGVERRFLRNWIDQQERSHRRVESIRPSSIPTCVLNRLEDDPSIDAEMILDRLEFRSREYESPRRARRRAVTAVVVIAAIVTATAFASFGLVRRTAGARQTVLDADNAIGQLVDSALGATSAASSAPRLRLTAAVRRLEATRDRSVSGLLARNAGAALIDLLAAWPDSIATQVDSVRVEQDVLSVKGRVRAAADAESLKLALDDGLADWRTQSSNVSKGRVGYEFTLVLLRSAEPTDQDGRP